MEGGGNRWTNVQGDSGDVSSSIEWRSQLHPDARQRIVNKIMETLKRHLPINGAEGISELNKIAVRFEEKIYTAATSQSDYLRKISMKMLTMEQKSQSTGVTANPITSGSTITGQGTVDPASLMQSQIRNQGLSMQVPVANQSQVRQQLLGPNLQNNVTSTTVQGTGSLSPALSSLNGMTQPNMSTFGQNQNMHSMPGIGQNSVNNTSGQNVPPSMYANSQRQIQGRSYQQSIMPQQHPQQSQNQLLYQQHHLKQKLQQASQMQSQIPQQQNTVMQVNQLQSSQQPLVQMSSSHQSNQGSLQHSQSTMIQSVPQNQQNPIQQSGPTLHQQSNVRQQPSQQPNIHQQTSSHGQQPSSITQQSAKTDVYQTNILPSQKQQNIGHLSNMSSVQSNQLLLQQNNISDLQQQLHQQQQHQRLTTQNGLMGMQQQMINQQNNPLHQQQQMPSQNSISSLQQQQSLQTQQPQSQPQPQMLGSQTSVSSMQHHLPVHMMQHSRAASQQVQQTPQSPLQLQNQQIQGQSSQQQHASQVQPQNLLQQPMAMQQIQQRLQASSVMLQPQNAAELQKQQFSTQRVLPDAPSTSVDSTAQTGQAGVDWQEEVYQKIKSLKEIYSADLQDMSQRIGTKLQQESLALPLKQSEQIEGMKKLKSVVERMLQLLHFPKSNIQHGLKEKLPIYEKQIMHILATRGRRQGPPQLQGQQLQQSGTQNLPMPQPPSQVSHQQQADSQLNQMQQVTFQPNSAPMPTAMSTMQIGSMPLPTQSGVSSTQVNILGPSQPGSNQETGSVQSSMQQGPIRPGSLQQSSINLTHQNNVNTLMQNNLNSHGINPLQANSNVMQPQIKQEQQQHQVQQMVIPKRMPQQLIPQRLQQQPQLRQQLQQKQQPNSQLPGNQMQLQQINEMNELKAKQVSSSKFQPHYSSGQRQAYYQQQQQQQQQQLHKIPTSFPISSPQNIQVLSPQISQHSSPQIDQQTLLSSVAKSGTPLHSVNSPFVVPSPSTPLAPSPLQVEQEKPPSTLSSLQNVVNVGNQQSILMPSHGQSLAVGTPGISASPLLAELSSMEGNQTTNMSVMVPGKPTAAELPVERLLKAMRSSPPEVLSSSAHDIASVVNMIDRIAGSAPGNGSRAAVGEDLVAMTKCRMQARNFMAQDGSGTKKMKRHTSAMPLNIAPSAGSVQDSLKYSSVESSELESTATSSIKKLKMETNNALLEEIKYVNQQLIDTVVDITDEDVDSISSTAECDGTVVKFTYCAVALSPSLKSQFASAKVSPILPMRLLIPSNYPHRSPVLLDKIPVESSDESEDLTVKARSRFSRSLRGLSQPMSLKEMARTWDVCARTVISEYAQASGGGTFCSRYGTWQNVTKA